MSVLITELLSRLPKVTDSFTKESAKQACSLELIRKFEASLSDLPSVAASGAARTQSNDNEQTDSTTTAKTPLHVALMLRKPTGRSARHSESKTPETKKAHVINNMGLNQKWRLHGDSNPGYSRERGVS